MSLAEVLANQRPWWIECGNALSVLKTMPDECVNLCVTSPPYFSLRRYHAGAQEIGQEKSPGEYVDNLVKVFREVKRVLRPEGTFWLNIGDSFASGGRKTHGTRVGKKQQTNRGMSGVNDPERADAGLPDGNLVGIPWLLAFALRDDGWNLRSDNIWVKTSPMPGSQMGWRWERCRKRDPLYKERHYSGADKGQGRQSSTERLITNCATARAYGVDHEDGARSVGWLDCPGCEKCKANGGFVLRKGSWRTTTAHEYLFMFSKKRHYYSDGFAVRQQLAKATILRDRYTRVLDDPDEQYAVKHNHETVSDPEAGANCRSTLIFRQEQFPGKHCAVFPPELPAFCIQCGTSEKGNCARCGMPWSRVIVKKKAVEQTLRLAARRSKPKGDENRCTVPPPDLIEEYETTAWRPSCSCVDAGPPIPALVLDCFSGSGTTGIACQRTCRNYLGVELNPEYAKDSRKRLATRGHSVHRTTKKSKKEMKGFDLP